MNRVHDVAENPAPEGAVQVAKHRLYKVVVLALLICLVSGSYLFLSIARGPQPIWGGFPERYALLARSFLQGSTALPIIPRSQLLALHNPYDPELNVQYRVQDVSLYKGRYYHYFGVTPAVTLFLPYRVLTGRDLTDHVAVPIYCILGFISSCAFFFIFARHNRWIIPFWLQCASVVALGSTSLVYLVLRRPSFYEVPIAAGYFFVMAGFLVLAWVVFTKRTTLGWFFVDGLLFGMSVGCRPHLVLICGILVIAVAIRFRGSPKLIIAMTAGLALCGIALGWYNYARFDNPLEFGRTYQLTTFSNDPNSTYRGLEYNLDGAYRSAAEFLFLPPRIDNQMPFFHMVFINPLPAHPGPALWMEEMVGAVPASPFLLLGFAFPIIVRERFIVRDGVLDHASIWLLYVMYCSAMAIFVLLCLVGWVLARYLLDFVPLLNFEALVLVATLWRATSKPWAKRFFQFAMGAGTIYGAAVNLAFAMPTWGSILKFLGK
jgi:hypothetical protein